MQNTFHKMPPDFLPSERKKIQFFGKIYLEKNTKNFIVNNNNRIIRAWHLQEVPGEHTYLPKKTGILPIKIIRNQDVFYHNNKTRGDIFEVKGISQQFR